LTLDAIVVDRPAPTAEKPQHLCLDKGYDNPTGEAACAQFGYTPHIAPIKPSAHWRRKTGCRRREEASCPPLGRRAHACLAVSLPCHFSALR